MAKKKPVANNEPVKTSSPEQDAVDKAEYEIVQKSTFEDQVGQVLKLQEERQSRIEKQVSQLVTVVTNLTQQKDVEKEKPKNPMDYLEAFNNLMNGPIGSLINKLIESVGTQEAPPPMPEAANPVSKAELEEVKQYREGLAKFQNRWFEALVSKAEAEATRAKKELESEF